MSIESEGRLGAASRLMADQLQDPIVAGERFLEAAEMLGLSLEWMWGVLEEGDKASWRSGKAGVNGGKGMGAEGLAGPAYSQVLLALPGSGKTAMLFLSGEWHPRSLWRRRTAPRAGDRSETGDGPERERALAERTALIEHACRELARGDGREGGVAAEGSVLAQTLLDPPAEELVRAYEGAGFLRLGLLAYLKLAISVDGLLSPRAAAVESWPEGVSVRCVGDLTAPADRIDAMLMQALEESYIDTRDCPELCGLRRVKDVLVSHRAVGQYDPRLWWVVMEGGKARGCVLLNPNVEMDGVELVYLGLGPTLRGRGLGSALMRMAIERFKDVLSHERRRGATEASGEGSWWSSLRMTGGITCAVDTRNPPALRLYERLGFRRTATRIPLVRLVGVK